MGKKTLLQMRVDLRTSLKDSGALWSDAELDRCIERIFGDLNRYLPREAIYEQDLQFEVTDESVTSPATTSLTAIVSAQSLDVAGGSFLTISGQPDKPRPLTLTITDADNSSYGISLIIRGLDRFDHAITERFNWSRGQSKTILGKLEFKTVYEVLLDQDAGSHAGDTLSVGYGTAYTAWNYLAYKPIKKTTITITDADATVTYVEGTDYLMDYYNGSFKLISGGAMAASTAYLVSYTKSQIALDLTLIPDLIRVQRVEYPVGKVPQSLVPHDSFDNKLFITGMGENDSQQELNEDSHIAVHYDALHSPPALYTPSSVPDVLEQTILMGAEAYALLIYVLKQEHQAVADIVLADAQLVKAADAHGTASTLLGLAIANIRKYLIDNTSVDALGIATAVTALITAVGTSAAKAEAMATKVDAETTGDIALAAGVPATYMGGTANYVNGGSAQPDIKKSITDGAALLNTISGAEQEGTPLAYAQYANVVKNALVGAFETHRQLYLQAGQIRAMAAAVDASTANANAQAADAKVAQTNSFIQIALGFAHEAEDRLAEIAQYIQEATKYQESAASYMVLADRFRQEALERRNEVYSIWSDRKQLMGDFTMGSVRQINMGE